VAVLGVSSRAFVLSCTHCFGSTYTAKVSLVDSSETHEVDVLQALRGVQGVPVLYTYGEMQGMRVFLTRGVGVDSLQYTERLLDEVGPIDGRWGLPMSTLMDMAEQLVHLLVQVHRMGYLHRDVCPRNIIFMNGRWCLCDFESAGRLGAADVDEQMRRRFVCQVEFASSRLVTSSAPLTADDDFEALAYSLTSLLDLAVWEADVQAQAQARTANEMHVMRSRLMDATIKDRIALLRKRT
jgi:serine/threonine protein kinase